MGALPASWELAAERPALVSLIKVLRRAFCTATIKLRDINPKHH